MLLTPDELSRIVTPGDDVEIVDDALMTDDPSDLSLSEIIFDLRLFLFVFPLSHY